mmetsp:Transcript_226/g.414  ORF Transcript_226/g.414 Transcript_226/m.414 type:complete len:98 (+) Transcript_226:356-649(+)
MYHDLSTWHRPKAEVKYSIKGTIEMLDGKVMKYKQMLVIHEPPVEFKQDANSTVVSKISTCCCQDKGQTQMTVFFDKNVFFNYEQANSFVKIDNSKC